MNRWYHLSFHRYKKTLAFVVLLLFVSFHTLIHPADDHAHDESCAVYVLETLFVAHDLPQTVAIERLFIPYEILFWSRTARVSTDVRTDAIRAPPLHS